MDKKKMSIFDFCFTLLTKKSEKIAIGHIWCKHQNLLEKVPSNFMVTFF